MIVLPTLHWNPTSASGNRHGHPVNLVVVHRWGVRYTSESAESQSYQGVINFFKDPSHGASAHIVFPGSAVPGESTQMVAWSDYAWAEAAYNPSADEIESADACWTADPRHPGKVVDEIGFQVLARMVAQRLHARGLPPVWSTSHGFCRHGDLGQAGGDHTSCPTTDMKLWKRFCREVQSNFPWDGKEVWGR